MTIEQFIKKYNEVIRSEYQEVFGCEPTKIELQSIFIKLLRQLDREESEVSFKSSQDRCYRRTVVR